ncbi:MAG: hypothetical protein EZS26_001830 [Candidatus Ordinivivax streblomastigis]|uniref:Leucine-rich repeat domain-containing protein n=1 Tax=Candidatus Ordinivivax streblomastigis TaxID=2540710 RepID=A0A5M8P0T5_9BACT|nr:MAG: hypothetical protein EZS26_001830 [Candidatus Ordinivivax streblomastigis]
MKKQMLVLGMLLLAVTSSFAGSGTTGPLTWVLEEGTLTISGEGAMPDYSYPSSSAPWYSSRSSITTVVIEDGVTTIGADAFFDCSSLSSVTIPNSVTTIGWAAFVGCSSLSAVTIGNSVTTIGDNAFSYCSSLSLVTIGNSVMSIGKSAFYGCISLSSVTIPNSVTTIRYEAFAETPWYNSKPDGVVYINQVLYNYKGIMPNNTTIDIQEGTVSIAEGAFYGCSSLSSVTIPNSVTTIGQAAFFDCSSLSSVTIPNSVTDIGNSAFENCSSLSSVTIPNSVTTIGYWAFGDCSSLSSVTIGNSVTAIEDYAFDGCISLSSITSNAIHPPAIGSNTFLNVPKNIPVYIPCEADYNAYQNSDWGKYFTTIIAKAQYPLQQPEICLVSADENNRNKVVWKKNEPVAAYNIYREGIQSGQYERVATIEYDGPNSWIDAETSANVRSYRYKVSEVDECGNESEFSSYHQTIHLSMNQGSGNQWNLNWNRYKGADCLTSNIYRASGNGSMELIASLPGHNTSYTDLYAPWGTVAYQIETLLAEPCEQTADLSAVRSNVVSNQDEVTALHGVAVGNASLVTVSDISGKTVLKQWVGANETVSVSHLPKGIYIVNAGGKVTKIVQ